MLGRLFLVLALLFGSAAANFRETKELRLKKDQIEKIMVVTEDEEYLMTFRWTLYHNGGLVVHRSYDGFNSQNVLKLNHNNQSVRIDIDTRSKSPKLFTYVVIKFKAFDFEKGEAVLELL
ncbi:MAG: hypothetical protein R3302_09125, partial [Sulfurimonadaceae bacterium]|nr:hypothetical protein [Sulfurimonadaceae bacterium]